MSHSSENSAGSEDDVSEGEAPESVSFGRSRQDALESISVALKETRRLKELTKEKRRTRHALLNQQRKKKIDLSSAKLPESVLEGISELDSQLQAKSTSNVSKTKTKESSEDEDDDNEGDEVEDDDEKEEGEESEEDGSEVSVDTSAYLNVGGFHAVALSEEKQKPPPTKETALEFLSKHLYGSHIHRESVNKQVSRLLKKEHKPAMHFTNPGIKKKRKRRRKAKGRNWESLLPK